MTPAELLLAEQLLTQGLAYWQNFQVQKAAGSLTAADLAAAAAKLDLDIDQLAADIAAQKAATP